MIEHKPHATLGRESLSWPKTRHHFSFAAYDDEARSVSEVSRTRRSRRLPSPNA